MKFVLSLFLLAALIATLQAAAVDNASAQPKDVEADSTKPKDADADSVEPKDADADSTTVAPTLASDVIEECHQPKETGRCFALFYRYAYNVENRQCEEFIYGGCNGNKNNFDSKEACEEKCLPKSNDAAEDKEESTTPAKDASDDAATPIVPAVDLQPAVAV